MKSSIERNVIYFNHSNSQHNGYKSEMLIRIPHFFLNWNVHIVKDRCHKEEPNGLTNHLVIK